MNQQEPDEIAVEDPTFAPWDGRRVPVTLLGGYLGAGKTTLINEILARTDVPIAVLVNDVGDINIDARLLKRADGDTLELTGGCVCCSLKNGFLEAFDVLRQREFPPDHVIVELSGVANPRAAAGLSSTTGFLLDGSVVLVDLDSFLERESTDSVAGDVVRAQVEAADLLLLTKQDLVSPGQVASVRARLSELAPEVPVKVAGSINAAAGLVGLAARRPVSDMVSAGSLFDEHRTDVIPMPSTIQRSELQAILDGLGPEVVRAKGIAQIETGEIVVAHAVGNRRSIETLPMAEMTDTTDLVVISI